jgi:uncharacterized protein
MTGGLDRPAATAGAPPYTDPAVRESPALSRLRGIVSDLGSCVVALSGGLDSTVLVEVAAAALGERCLAVTADSGALPTWDRDDASAAAARARTRGAHTRVIETHETEDPRYARNQRLRCYYCKAGLFGELRAIADREGYRWVVDGTNASDLGTDDRPGVIAARHLGVRSPLAEAGLFKDGVRALARELGLADPERPSSACLASRIPFGSPITDERLRRVEAAELAVRALGFRQVRVRDLGRVGRVEVDDEELGRLRVAAGAVRDALALAGFPEVEFGAYRGHGAGRVSGAGTVVLDGAGAVMATSPAEAGPAHA